MKKNKTLNNYCYIFDGYNYNLSEYIDYWNNGIDKVLKEYAERSIDAKPDFCLGDYESNYHDNKYYSDDADLFEYWYCKPYSLRTSADNNDTLISVTDSYGNQTLESLYYDY